MPKSAVVELALVSNTGSIEIIYPSAIQTSGTHTHKINIKGLNKKTGVYYVRLSMDGEAYYKKVFVNNL